MTTIKNNCKQIIRIAKMELSTMFYSPIAWLLLVVFAFQVGSIFADKLDNSLRAIDMDRGLFALSTIFFTGTGSVFAEVVKNIYLYIPLLTMGLMSREYSSGSIKLLYSSPIKDSSIVLGKFFAMVVYGFVLMSVAFIYVGFSGIVIENFEWGMVLTGMLGIFLLLCAYSAIGLFMSSLTSYQVVAAIGTLALLSVLNYVKEVGQNIEFVKQITYWLSLSGRVDVFIKGLISSEGVVYFITVIVLFILLTIFRINGERE
ncbi:MAG: ABC transporter permease subunit, partial [Rikenellaceae bacterium]